MLFAQTDSHGFSRRREPMMLPFGGMNSLQVLASVHAAF